ncbi:hypothetical protein EVG20_g6492 [Dentipellis fragilis]|uniref:CHAT domain-containing protein n=1 Tax=Dentipellis fragilis TaxID=205917 RepID=A0A4Y9YLL3_9AGAM|nr:hypothetical protein EVG20_g6492 [Dentipellis fragilis]
MKAWFPQMLLGKGYFCYQALVPAVIQTLELVKYVYSFLAENHCSATFFAGSSARTIAIAASAVPQAVESRFHCAILLYTASTVMAEDDAQLRQALLLSSLSSDEFDEQLAQVQQVQSQPSTQDTIQSVVAPLLYQLESQNYEQFLRMVPQAVEILGNMRAGHPILSKILDEATNIYYNRYSQTGSLHDMDGFISVQQQIVDLVALDDTALSSVLNDLGVFLRFKFERTGNIEDIEKAISVLRRAIDLNAFDPAKNHGRLDNLAISLFRRFEATGDITDVNNAISFHRQAIELKPIPQYFGNLANSLHRRFERLNNIADINDAIVAHRQAIDPTPDSNPQKPHYLSNYGNSLCCHFEQVGDVEDLNDAIRSHSQAVELTPAGDNALANRLSNLGASLLRRFQRFGNPTDIDDAIYAHRRAVGITSDDHPAKADCLSNLGNALDSRFERFGRLRDCNDSVAAHRKAVELTPLRHADTALHLSNLGKSLDSRFGYTCQLTDIDDAILAHRKAVDATPDTHTERPKRLGNLGSSLSARFEAISDTRDINEVLVVYQRAFNLIPNGHPDRPLHLNNLANTFYRRFDHFGKLDDIDDAIATGNLAVDSAADDYASKPLYLSNLATALRCRFKCKSNDDDLKSAISMYRRAIELTGDDQVNKPMYLTNLGASLAELFRCSRSTTDIDEAITTHVKAIELTPEGHVGEPGHLINLGTSLAYRFDHAGDRSDADRALAAYESAAVGKSIARDAVRINAALRWARLCITTHSPDSTTLRAFATVFQHIPRLIWLGVGVQHRYEKLSVVGETVNEAVAFAIGAGEMDMAIQWLEEGRCVVWSQILQLRTPLDDLKKIDPELADELEAVSHLLDRAGSSGDQLLEKSRGTGSAMSLEEEGQKHRRLAERYEKLLEKAREIPELQHFLRPKLIADLRPAATAGPVVLVNVHETHCDALVLSDPRAPVQHVPLPKLTPSVAMDMRSHFLTSLQGRSDSDHDRYSVPVSLGVPSFNSIEGTLRSIWLQVVKPILDTLGYLTIDSSRESIDFPHITWCATGPLAFLPIHAAGIYSSSPSKGRECIFDYVVSSYTPTLTALLSPYQPSPSRPHYTGARLLAISQPNTPRQRPLPGTRAEVQVVKAYFVDKDFNAAFKWLDGKEATKASVLEEMKTHNWIHLACHGIQHKTHPMQSAFLLDESSLTLLDIMQSSDDSSTCAYDLAVLSACQTATGVNSLPEEAAHLAAGMITAGYRSVIATMWFVGDSDAPIVAREFYKALMESHGGDSRKSAYALHHAVKYLREEIGQENFVRWMPFIHMGV